MSAGMIATAVMLLCLASMPISGMFTSERRESMSDSQTSDQTIIKGIRFSSFKHGHRINSVEIGAMGVTGKKQGFLRLGIWKVVRCDDVHIDIFSPASERILAGEDLLCMLSGNRNGRGSSTEKGHGRQGAALVKKLDTITGKKMLHVKGMEFHNLTVTLHTKNGSGVEIYADFGEISFNSNRLALCGRVSVTNMENKRALQTEKARWNLSNGTITVPNPYTIDINGTSARGAGITTDLGLNNISRVAAPAKNNIDKKEA